MTPPKLSKTSRTWWFVIAHVPSDARATAAAGSTGATGATGRRDGEDGAREDGAREDARENAMELVEAVVWIAADAVLLAEVETACVRLLDFLGVAGGRSAVLTKQPLVLETTPALKDMAIVPVGRDISVGME